VGELILYLHLYMQSVAITTKVVISIFVGVEDIVLLHTDRPWIQTGRYRVFMV